AVNQAERDNQTQARQAGARKPIPARRPYWRPRGQQDHQRAEFVAHRRFGTAKSSEPESPVHLGPRWLWVWNTRFQPVWPTSEFIVVQRPPILILQDGGPRAKPRPGGQRRQDGQKNQQRAEAVVHSLLVPPAP